MKKSITGMVLLASAISTASDLSDLAKENGLHVACVSASRQNEVQGYFLNGGGNLTASNNFYGRKLNANGCADGQIQVVTVEEIQMSPTPVML